MVVIQRIDLARALSPPLDQHLHVNVARLVSPAAIPEHVIEVIEAEGLAASLIRPVEERAMLAFGRHKTREFPADGNVIDRGGGEASKSLGCARWEKSQ
jgi:hypothetical protein